MLFPNIIDKRNGSRKDALFLRDIFFHVVLIRQKWKNSYLTQLPYLKIFSKTVCCAEEEKLNFVFENYSKMTEIDSTRIGINQIWYIQYWCNWKRDYIFIFYTVQNFCWRLPIHVLEFRNAILCCITCFVVSKYWCFNIVRTVLQFYKNSVAHVKWIN